MSQEKIVSQLETLLFASGDPQSKLRLMGVLDVEESVFDEAFRLLEARYAEDSSGLSLVRLEDKIQMVTKKENAPLIKEMLESELEEGLSKSALETLSIVAYRSPVTRAEIDSIRGVNSSFSLRNLLIRGLIERKGNPNDARGYVYTPTVDFLKTLGLASVIELPQYEILSKDDRIELLLKQNSEEVPSPKEKDPESKEVKEGTQEDLKENHIEQ